MTAASLLINALAPSTRQTYRRSITLYLKHVRGTADGTHPLPFPVKPPSLISFICHLHNTSYAPSTILTFISAISFVNKLYNAHDPRQNFLINKMLEGAKKIGHTPDCRQPITLNILHKIIAAVPIIQHSTHNIALYKAMFLTAFHAFLRVGEITVRSLNDQHSHTLQVSDCQVLFKGTQVASVQLTLKTWKHSKGQPCFISVPANHSTNCPANAIHQYLLTARPVQGPLFTMQDGTPVTRTSFTSSLKRCLQAANIPTTFYKGHSFRIGAATEAVASLGLPDHEVQRMGRWSSGAFKQYIRSPHFQTIQR